MRNILINLINAKSGGQMTYLVNLLSETASLHNYRFTFLINMVANNQLKSAAVHIPENVSIYSVSSGYSYGVASYIWQVFNLPRIVQEVKPDYVFAPTHIAYKVPGVKTILAMRNMAIPNFLKIDVPLRMRLNLSVKYLASRYSLRRADKVVAVSNYVKDFLKRNIGKDEKDIFVAYHMINSLHRDNDSLPEQYGDIEKNDYIVFVPGSYYRYKKFHALLNYLESVKLPPNARVIFAGDEADKKYLSQLKQHRTTAYEPIFKVSLSVREMKFFYKIARLVILSSQVEACPNIALEALANKSRVLASNIPPFKEILGDFATYFKTDDRYDFVRKFEMAVSCEPDAAVQAKQMKKVSGGTILDILQFSESD
ncbi:glycosyltransferase [Planctomycetota bacterium]